MTWTLIANDGEVEITGLVVAPDALTRATGWELKPEGLCRGAVCVPVRDGNVAVEGGVDLRAAAAALRTPFAVDDDAQVAVLGTPATKRAEQQTGMEVGDFTLHDVDGTAFTWSSIGRKKKLFVAWASW